MRPRYASVLVRGLLQVLIADFFFICVALAWLAAGVAEKGSLNSTVGPSSLPVCEAAVPGHKGVTRRIMGF